MDHPEDPETWTRDDQYTKGEDILVAAVIAGQRDREVYLPKADGWFDFWTKERHAGGTKIRVAPPLNQIALFVKTGTLLPLGQPSLSTRTQDSSAVSFRRYGESARPCTLFEDDGSVRPTFTRVAIRWDGNSPAGTLERSGTMTSSAWHVVHWEWIA